MGHHGHHCRGDIAAARAHGLQALAEGGSAAVAAEIWLVNAEEWSGHDQLALLYSIDLEAKSQVRAPGRRKRFSTRTGWWRRAGWKA